LIGRFVHRYPYGRFKEKEPLKWFLLWAVNVRIFKYNCDRRRLMQVDGFLSRRTRKLRQGSGKFQVQAAHRGTVRRREVKWRLDRRRVKSNTLKLIIDSN
jgi:hypothetical protein